MIESYGNTVIFSYIFSFNGVLLVGVFVPSIKKGINIVVGQPAPFVPFSPPCSGQSQIRLCPFIVSLFS